MGLHSGASETNGHGIQLSAKMLAQLNEWLKVEEEEVDLRDKKLGKAGVKELGRLNNHLHLINLSKNELGGNGLKHFPRVEWNNLYSLDLGGNQLNKEGIDLLVQTSVPNLKMLNLWGNQIGHDGVLSLMLSKWANLESLNLCNFCLTQTTTRY